MQLHSNHAARCWPINLNLGYGVGSLDPRSSTRGVPIAFLAGEEGMRQIKSTLGLLLGIFGLLQALVALPHCCLLGILSGVLPYLAIPEGGLGKGDNVAHEVADSKIEASDE
jgi:hypothetical protein